jgi:hypothetical protein
MNNTSRDHLPDDVRLITASQVRDAWKISEPSFMEGGKERKTQASADWTAALLL